MPSARRIVMNPLDRGMQMAPNLAFPDPRRRATIRVVELAISD